MITGKSEITIKFNELPAATAAPNKKVEVSLTDQNGVVFTALINAKSWKKAEANAQAFADWGGSVSGKLGNKTEVGFQILEAGITIFEKKPKEPQPEIAEVSSEALPVS